MKSLKLACAALLAAFSAHAAAVGSLADVTLFDRSDGRQLPVYWHEGRAYVVGKPGNEYSVRIRNRQRDDVLGVISVDGVNVITGPGFRPRSARVNWEGIEARGRYEVQAKFTTWLDTIAHNRLVDYWRKRGLTLV